MSLAPRNFHFSTPLYTCFAVPWQAYSTGRQAPLSILKFVHMAPHRLALKLAICLRTISKANLTQNRLQQGLLATYVIPGCVGRGVKLGSESSSGGGAGTVWKSGDQNKKSQNNICRVNIHHAQNHVITTSCSQVLMPKC